MRAPILATKVCFSPPRPGMVPRAGPVERLNESLAAGRKLALLTGPVVDQAALHGLLKRVRDLGMPLVSVSPLEHGQAHQSDVK
jgi:hypothetical protein